MGRCRGVLDGVIKGDTRSLDYGPKKLLELGTNCIPILG